MVQPTRGKLFYRFASESTLREFLFALSSSAGDIRSQLKRYLSITTPLDIVLYQLQEDGKSSRRALADSSPIHDGQKLLVKRVPESLARSILSAVAESSIRSHDQDLKSVTASENSKTSSSVIDIYEGLEALSDSDDELQELPDSPNPYGASSVPSGASSHHSLNISSVDPSSLSTSVSSSLSSVNSSSSSLSSASPLSSRTLAEQSCNQQADGPDEQSQFDPNLNFDDDDDDSERDQMLMHKVMIDQKSSFILDSKTDHTSFKPKDNIANRYYRNRNLIWSKNSESNQDSYAQLLRPFTNIQALTSTMKRGQWNNHQISVVPVKENYVCHICGEKGHHIRNCPKGNDPKKHKKVKPSTGLPRSWLQRISDDDVAQCETDVYSLPGWNERLDSNSCRYCIVCGHWCVPFARRCVPIYDHVYSITVQ